MKDGNWFFKDIENAVGEAYISGYEDGTLKPNDPITRQEASVVLGRLLANIENKQAVWDMQLELQIGTISQVVANQI